MFQFSNSAWARSIRIFSPSPQHNTAADELAELRPAKFCLLEAETAAAIPFHFPTGTHWKLESNITKELVPEFGQIQFTGSAPL